MPTYRAYYTAAAKTLTVRLPSHAVHATVVVKGLADARKVCKARGWTLWNV